MTILKSKQPPHTKRWTEVTPGTALIVARCVAIKACAAANDALDSSAPSHLQRHSRAIVSKSTPSTMVGIFLERERGERRVGAVEWRGERGERC